MKEPLLVGGVTGVLLGMLAYGEHRHVDPHTVSVFPSPLTIAAVLLAFVAMTWLLQRLRRPSDPAALTMIALRCVFAASAVYAIPFIAITYRNWVFPTIWIAGANAVMSAAAIAVVGSVTVAITAHLLMRLQRRTT